jgi:hypothetical protein
MAVGGYAARPSFRLEASLINANVAGDDWRWSSTASPTWRVTAGVTNPLRE